MKRVRVRKARHSGRCPRCGCWVPVGALIASVRGAPFMCIAHVTRQDTDGNQDLPADRDGGSAKEQP